MQSHSSRWRIVLLLAVFALVVAACSSDDSSDDETTTTAAAETTTTAAATDDETTTTTAAPSEPVEPPSEEGTTLSGLTVIDDKTFTVELVNADPEFPVQLAYTAFFPLPSVAYENTLGYNKAPIGNGPFMFPEGGEWVQDVGIDLVKYPDYAGERMPTIDGISFVISADLKTNYLEAQAGNLDVVTGIDPDFLASAPTDFGSPGGGSVSMYPLTYRAARPSVRRLPTARWAKSWQTPLRCSRTSFSGVAIVENSGS